MPGPSCLPQSADRDRAQARPEGKGLGPGVEDEAGDEVIAGSFGQMTQAAKVSRRDRRGGLDLDPDDVSLTVLQDRVYLNLVLRAVMEQLGALLRPGELPGQFHEHESFQQGAERPAGPQQA